MTYKILGRAINDADYKTTNCPIYKRWVSMLERCYSRPQVLKRPSYKDCKVSKDWLKFTNFRNWVVTQFPDWENKQLDKDLLVKGNKLYSAETCLFVDNQVNGFLKDRAASRGKFPLGVYKRSDSKVIRFRARCNNPITKKSEFLGDFVCPNLAHEAWRKRKHELACELADMQKDERVAKALRNYYV